MKYILLSSSGLCKNELCVTEPCQKLRPFQNKTLKNSERPGQQRSRWTWSTSLSTDTRGTHLQTQKCMQNTSWKRTGVPDQWERIYRTTQNLVGWRNQGERQELVGLGLPSAGGGTEAGVQSPHHVRAVVWVRGETFKAESETSDLRQPEWNENQTVLATAVHTPDRDAGPLEGAVVGLWSNPRARAAVDCGETDWGGVREETVVGNACGGKPGSHGSKAILLSQA